MYKISILGWLVGSLTGKRAVNKCSAPASACVWCVEMMEGLLRKKKRTRDKVVITQTSSILNEMVGARGFEPPTTWPPAKYATRLRYAPMTAITSAAKFCS